VKLAELMPLQLLQRTAGTPGCVPLQEPAASVGVQDCGMHARADVNHA
jgi:hypothetical protein